MESLEFDVMVGELGVDVPVEMDCCKYGGAFESMDPESFEKSIQYVWNHRQDLRMILENFIGSQEFCLTQSWSDFVSGSTPVERIRLKLYGHLDEDVFQDYLSLIHRKYNACITSIMFLDRPQNHRQVRVDLAMVKKECEVYVPIYLDHHFQGHWNFMRLTWNRTKRSISLECFEPIFSGWLVTILRDWLSTNFPNEDINDFTSRFDYGYTPEDLGLLTLMKIRQLASGSVIGPGSDIDMLSVRQKVLAELVAGTLDPVPNDLEKFWVRIQEMPLSPVWSASLVDEKALLLLLHKAIAVVRSRSGGNSNSSLLSIYTSLGQEADEVVRRFKRATFSAKFFEEKAALKKLLGERGAIRQIRQEMDCTFDKKSWMSMKNVANKARVWVELKECAKKFVGGPEADIMIGAVLDSTTEIESLPKNDRLDFIERMTGLLQSSPGECHMLRVAGPLYLAIVQGNLPPGSLAIETLPDLEASDFTAAVSMDCKPQARLFTRFK